MKNPETVKRDYLNQHARPVTRRDFITRGLYGACGMAFAPTLLGWLLENQANAKSASASAPKFITFDLAGGAALFANFLVGGRGGPEDLLPSYSLLGWDPKAPGALDRRFGLPMAGAGVSQLLQGILATASAEAQTNLRIGSLLHAAQIDTADNPLSILSLVAASQLCKGGVMSSSLGIKQTLSGGKSQSLLDLASNRPFFVNDLDVFVNSVGLGGALTPESDKNKQRIAKLLNRLSRTQLKKLVGGPLSQAGFDYIASGLDALPTRIEIGNQLDARLDPDFQQIYSISPASDSKSAAVLRAALAMTTLKGIAGPCVITIEGCDYHDQTQSSGDAKDLEIGQEIGRVIEAARRLKTSVFIHVITDGGIYPNAGTRTWAGDDVEKCMSLVGLYTPSAPPQPYLAGRMQIGSYTANQGADRTTLVGGNPAVAANAAFANYLSAAGRMDLLNSVYPASLPAKDLEPALLFGAIS